jgi:hypothetical protein
VASTQALRHVRVLAREGMAARCITAVTSISSAGTLWQHATGKNSRATRLWEKSMQFKRQLPGGPSLRRFSIRRAEETIAQTRLVANTDTTRTRLSAALGPRLGSHLEVVHRPGADDRLVRCERGIRISPNRNALPRSILAGRSRVVMKSIGGFAARGEAAFESLLLAAMSWAIAQALAGCAVASLRKPDLGDHCE